MSEKLKKLTGKNPKDFEPAVYSLVNDCDIELFSELVQNDDFLFDFVKNNVAQRIKSVCNSSNYMNLIHFLKYYSPSYEDVIVSTLVEFADEDLTDTMLEKFENGNDDEKTYAAKYFSFIKDSLAYDLLLKNSYSDNDYLMQNCAYTLSIWKDEKSFKDALEKLKKNDDFEKVKAVKFLSAYGNKDAVFPIIDAMKTSAMSENIAGEIPYLMNLFELFEQSFEDGLLVLNNIINGLAEILPLSSVFDYELFDVFEFILTKSNDSKCSVVLLNAVDKFEIFNDEYLFDEDKETKAEIQDIKKLLKRTDKKQLSKNILPEINENSQFVYTALDFAEDILSIKELLKSNNQTLVLKTAESLKRLNAFDETSKTVALLKINDINIKDIIRAL